MTIQGFVISLARAVERQQQVKKIIDTCPLTCEPLLAVDGSRLEAAQIEQITKKKLYTPQYPFSLKRGEIGVFLSHRRAWQEIVSRNLSAGLILEDDVSFDPRQFPSALQMGIEALNTYDVVKLPIVRKRPDNATTLHSPQITSPILPPLGATSMLVRRTAAKRLLELTEQFDRPVDTFLQMNWISELAIGIVSPSGIYEISHTLGGSTIQTKSNRLTEKISREVKRFFYRRHVYLLAHFPQLNFH